ncbi:MAG: TerB family tellurite resistance protein [Candidatus Neomarinimicrobiota bacterium]|nr:TerB family tellurite resistance protein [Candidatus Neomarinimicrobiota bacterium]
MNVRKKMFWGGLGWVLGGPIGAIIGYSMAGMSTQQANSSNYFESNRYPKTQPGDFMISLLVLFASVMKADSRMLKSELDYVKEFLSKEFSKKQVHDFMILFKDILKQDYPLKDVCRQIARSMDHPSRLELIHILFGLSLADGNIHSDEEKLIHTISNYLNINQNDFSSIKAMFVKNFESDYKILEIPPDSSDEEVKKAYRKMAVKYHPDKVNHLGEEVKSLAEEKFKMVNEAYSNIKKARNTIS